MSRLPNISKKVRQSWTGGHRNVPTMERPAQGFYIGLVMDDRDDQGMGRIWVYIPGFGARRGDEGTIPNYGGTTPDRQTGTFQYDEKVRTGWIICSPLFPLAGGDDYRVTRAGDGRNARTGDTNSYGFSYQPRIGDAVGVIFDQSDSASAYWIGCVPKQFRNFMVPGTPAVPKTDLNQDSKRVTDQVQNDALLPAMDQAKDDNRDQNEGIRVATLFADNLIASGLAYDIHRGAGTSSSRRESPSYVMGFKSPGWVYDSEKYNLNIDGTQFEQGGVGYAGVNTTGHQLVMDDHPDHQGVRIRTSAGSQVYLNDSCDHPYIYITTARGNVWIELGDDGNMNLFGEGSFSVHAKGDINLTADRDINLEAGGNMNLFVHGDYRSTVNKETHIARIGNTFISNSASVNHEIDVDHLVSIKGDRSETIGGNYSDRIGGDFSHTVSGGTFTKIGGGAYLSVTGIYSEQATRIYMNSGITATPSDTVLPQQVSFPKLTKKPGDPTQSQIKGGDSGEATEYLSPIVPQHQPWPVRCGGGSSRKGTNGAVSPRGNNRTSTGDCNPDATKNFRKGAATNDASAPLPYIAGNQEIPQYFEGVPYTTENRGEEPDYRPVNHALQPATGPWVVQDVANLTYSGELVNFVKQQETFSQTPTFDVNGNPIIGYGHSLQVGDVIGGTTITQKILTDLKRGGVTATDVPVYISEQEATSQLVSELNATGEEVRGLFPTGTQMSVDMFSSLVSLGRNVGVDQLKNTQEGRNVVDGVINNDPQKVQENYMKFAYVNGELDCDVQNSRAKELENAGQGNPYGDGNPDYTPGESIGCNNSMDTKIDSKVLQAIQDTSEKYDIPYEYLMSVAGNESGFDPTAKNSSPSGAAGIFQFIGSTWTSAGVGGGNLDDRFEPSKNVDPMGRLTTSNAAFFRNNFGRDPNNTELYMVHFLGPESTKMINGAYNDPNRYAYQDFRDRTVSENPWSFYHMTKDANGNWVTTTPKTYGEIYNEYDKKMKNGVANFGGCRLPEE